MNSKERKKLLQTLQDQFGIEELPDGAYIRNAKDKVYVVNREIELIPYEKLYIDAIGLYLGAWQIDGFRLSIEGSQWLAPMATKNKIVLSADQRVLWLKGLDLDWEADAPAFVIVTYGVDVLGCGKIRMPRDGKDESCLLLNYVPKARRLIVINE